MIAVDCLFFRPRERAGTGLSSRTVVVMRVRFAIGSSAISSLGHGSNFMLVFSQE